jgi:acetoacetyl-CoA synthetase
VRLRDGEPLTTELADRIKQTIRVNTTPRHVPARIVTVTEIPRTKSGKIVELAVRNVVHGREVRNIEALANPEVLEQFRDLEVLKT